MNFYYLLLKYFVLKIIKKWHFSHSEIVIYWHILLHFIPQYNWLLFIALVILFAIFVLLAGDSEDLLPVLLITQSIACSIDWNCFLPALILIILHALISSLGDSWSSLALFWFIWQLYSGFCVYYVNYGICRSGYRNRRIKIKFRRV